MVKIREAVLERESEVADYIEQHANTFGLEANLIRALITQESRFNGDIRSPTGAYGYGQFTRIGAKQVQNISRMNPLAADLRDFVKDQASDPDVGIKAICATLWWLFNRKYKEVDNLKVQLEAVLTFYNAGGTAAALVIKYGGHSEALSALKRLPSNRISQSPIYAPEVSAWYVAWDAYFELHPVPPAEPELVIEETSVEISEENIDSKYSALIKALEVMAAADKDIDFTLNTGCGMTEVTLIFPGEDFG